MVLSPKNEFHETPNYSTISNRLETQIENLYAQSEREPTLTIPYVK